MKKRNLVYAGNDARKTPDGTRQLMRRIAARLTNLSWTLRTGGAPGADQALLEGALRARNAQILLGPDGASEPVRFAIAWTEGGRVVGGGRASACRGKPLGRVLEYSDQNTRIYTAYATALAERSRA